MGGVARVIAAKVLVRRPRRVRDARTEEGWARLIGAARPRRIRRARIPQRVRGTNCCRFSGCLRVNTSRRFELGGQRGDFDLTIWTGATPILYHGTTRRNWSRIRRNGFRLSKSGHYLGHGVCLSESIAVAYAHGAYEDGGVVLEVCLPEGTRWSEGGAGDLDRWLADGPADATRAYGGNVWVMWHTQDSAHCPGPEA
ncbi:hypothetical protein Bpfe_031095 [Biomphalaria pfeifferi]|uniref:PARP catalytic domain-containing protein n=1 Tax=Biomphalaria pfeifferi TaxID=112525 RepID=A0AAD8ANQ0_BIOPF|nr:hypothetical protein Bpfe_031095 [Biomphalaria pfeifferi]